MPFFKKISAKQPIIALILRPYLKETLDIREGEVNTFWVFLIF